MTTSLWGKAAEPSIPAPVAAPASEPTTAVLAPAGTIIGQVLPMYFVGDESHSMAGDPIAAVNQGLIDLRDEVAKHPLIGRKVRLGIITFADTAETRLGLSELTEDVVLPVLAPRGRGNQLRECVRGAAPGDPGRRGAAQGQRLSGPPALGVLPQRRAADREGGPVAGAIAEFAASMLNSMVASAERLDRGEQTIEFEKPEGFVQLDAPLV